jgi:hypothetical protein
VKQTPDLRWKVILAYFVQKALKFLLMRCRKTYPAFRTISPPLYLGGDW